MASLLDRVRRVPPHRLAELIAAATYGTVLVLAALSAISVADVSIGYSLELVAGVGFATWVAHLFAELLAGHVYRHHPLDRHEVAEAVADGSPILASTVLPAISLLLGRLDVVTAEAARTLAIVAGFSQLIALGVLAGHLAPARHAALWVSVTATCCVGVGVVAITARLH